MNELFVNIKVDREERPDLDRIYQNAHYLLNRRSGGWPLTVFLTPHDQTPFYSGTYFPPRPRHGLPGFRDLLLNVARAFEEQQEAIAEQGRALKTALDQLTTAEGPVPEKLVMTPFEAGVGALKSQFDARHGGFGQAPKFPHPDNLGLLLRAGSKDPEALRQALFTLEKMALGGIDDQLGGGFCRYSVDEQWMIPHFEKMLYDNGPLLGLYAEAWRLTGDPLLRRTCETTAGWVTREMQAPAGGYYSSLDADSEGEEGRFYVWDREEIQRILAPEEYALFAQAALDFIHENLWREGRLLAVHKDGISHLDAYLDDYAWLIQALLELLQHRWNSAHLEWAVALAEVMLEHYQDRKDGGFYFTADDHEQQLIQRPKSFADDATPSGNGIAAQVLLELSHITGDLRYLEAAERTIEAAWWGIRQAPQAHASLLLALKALLAPGELVIIRGPQAELPAWQQAALAHFRPERSLYAVPETEARLPEPLALRRAGDGTCAWICRGVECLPPVTTPEALRESLSA